MNNTTNYRIFVEKLPRFRVEAESLRRELNTNLNLSLGEVRLLCVYDLFGFSEELLEKSRYTVFGEVVTDSVTDTFNLAGRKYIAVEYLPGQFDQRAASAVDCVRLIDPEARVDIRSSRLLVFDDKTTDGELAKIRHYYINAVESREKDLSVLSDMEQAEVKPVGVLEGFREMADSELEPYCKTMGLAMNADDLREVVKYFRSEGRDPYETELRILDTYWSDHCRHTTFTTELEGITVEESFVKDEIEDSLALYLRIRRELGREHKSICLMDMATIGARYLRKKGLLDDMEVSDENNACSVYIDVDVDGRTEKWLLQFKNETHNHPTEIEPFGGNEYAVRAVPDNLFSLAKKDLLMELIDGLSDDSMGKNVESVYDRIATMSCKAAVKGNNELSFAEADQLIDELLKLENPYNCPHGRPTIVAISKYEMEKKFKRIV